MLKRIFISTSLILSLAFVGFAQVPQYVNYQGMLSDASGNPLSGSYTIKFRIYSASSGGSLLWGPHTSTVNADAGYFSAELGPIAYSVFDGNERWLSLQVGNDAEMTPRKRLLSVGNSYRAYDADKVDGKHASAFVQTGQANSVSTNMLQNNAVTTSKISPRIVSSVDGVSNDGGNIDLVGSNGITITPDDANNKITFKASGGGDNDWTISGNDMFSAVSGNVGIGTSNPGAKLQVGAGEYLEVIPNSPSNYVTLGTPNSHMLLKSGGNTEISVRGVNSYFKVGQRGGGGGSPGDLLYVNGNGKVGIGTSNPTYKLDVNGAILASSGMKSLGGDTGVYGQGATYGVYGKKGSSSTGNFGYLGSTNYGAYGKSFNITGIYGEGPTGVHGKSTSNSIGVQGDGGTGVYGNGTKIGVYATGGNWAVWSQGNCHVTGVLTKSIGAFKIDHPLDPANKFLYHSFVESPDMKNIYDGVVKLDDKGEAIVELPDWFEALNTDFRYQLTAIGAPGPNLYIAEKISNNRFKIAGGKAAMEVSWHVTGIRNDAYAKAHRIKVEVNKRPEERGKYLAPIEHGFPESLGIGYAERMRIKTEQASFLEK